MEQYLVSARKYRPTTFASVVGQKTLVATLRNAVTSGKLAHAYLFCGPRGVGKTTCARIFAKSINCLHPAASGDACNECESCVSFNEQRSFNIHELDAASNNSVDDIRELTEQVRIPPQIGKYKVYIIDEVHMLSTAAFNAFLKTLEEPPHYALFVLATTEKHKILPTILSRCQIYDFTRISIADTVDHLRYVAELEGFKAEENALNVIAQKSDGGMRDALSIFDQVAGYTEGNITYDATIANLNVLDYDYYFALTDAIIAAKVPDALLILDKIILKGFDLGSFIGGLASYLRDLMVLKDPQTAVLFDVSEGIKECYLKFAAQLPLPFLYKAIEWSNDCDRDYRTSRNKRLLIELLLIRLCQFNVPSVDDVKKKLQPLVANPEAVHKAEASTPTVPTMTVSQPTPQSSASENKQRTSTQQGVPAPLSVPQPLPQSPATPPSAKTLPSPTSKPKMAQRRPMSTSMKVQTDDPANTSSQASTPEEVCGVSPFTDDQFLREWYKMISQYGDRPQLSNTLDLNTPMPKSEAGNNYERLLRLVNQMQYDQVVAEMPMIHRQLRKQLDNRFINIEVIIEQSNDVNQIAYTADERLQKIVEVNPLINLLRERLDLVLA